MAESYYRVIDGTADMRIGQVVKLDPSKPGYDFKTAAVTFTQKVVGGDPTIPVYMVELETHNAGAGVVMDPMTIYAKMKSMEVRA